jgi:hypothetical protein
LQDNYCGHYSHITYLCVMCIPVRARTARLVRIRWIVEVDVLQASGACLVTGLGANSNGVLVVPVDDDLSKISYC